MAKTGEVNIKKYVKLEGKWQFVAIPKDKGKLRLSHILVNGLPQRSVTGTFYLEFRLNGKRVQRPVGTDARLALEAYRDQVDRMRTGAPLLPVLKPLKESTGTMIQDAIDSFLVDVKATKSKATYRDYRPSLAWFQTQTQKEYVSDLDRSDIMALFLAGRGAGLQQKTINKRVTTIVNCMGRAGAKIELLKGDWPSLTVRQVETYRGDELVTFFKYCNTRERLLFQVFLCSGFRHMEVATLTWSDVDWVAGSLAVTSKQDIEFTPKTYEERSVSVPRALIQSLKEYRGTNPKSRFIFPTEAHPTRKDIGGDGVDGKMLETCKEIALRAGLNCGRCTESKMGRCVDSPTCSKWYLHKFRHTFATEMLHSGLDIKSVQLLMGHKRITTTERYLRGLRLSELRDKVESSSLAGLVA